ncbi:hypothetical protein [uncultured Desulfovibrio sp.]|uniref:hypothetical protein n=1 Tax=uncultured Desulfovibrio sp. TaxID=167968 RepID=UPI00262ECE9C|nr:hypothetical protein [uncultured Desulfovibrio sp.]
MTTSSRRLSSRQSIPVRSFLFLWIGVSPAAIFSSGMPFSAKSILPLKKAKCEAEAQRCPAETKRKNRVFSAKRQAVWFETQSVSTENAQ